MKATLPLFFSILSLVWSCGTDKDDENKSGKATKAKLTSSKLASAGLTLTQDVALTNVTGLADSIGFNFTEDVACGFDVWSANSQSGRSGTEGRTYESFNLGQPETWESQGEGLQGECDSAQVSQVESYFVYMDLHLTVDEESKVVRAYMAQQAPFEAGDIVIKDGDVLSWLDKDADALVASTATRPSQPAQFTLKKTVPWFDNNGADKIIMMEFRIETDKNETYKVTKDTGYAEIDVDFSKSGISITDTSSDAAILDTISLPFLEADEFNSLLTASLQVANDPP